MPSLKKAIRLTKTCLAAGRNVFWTGQPGIGKTEVIRDMCRGLKADEIFKHLASPKDSTVPVMFGGVNATTMESVDVRGALGTVQGRTIWYPPAFIPSQGEAAVLFIDEFPQAEETTQIALMRLIDRDLDGCKVSERCGFICAGNRIEDNAGARLIPQHIRNRFTWIDVDLSVDEWIEWADVNFVRPEIVEFIAQHRSMLNTFNPKSNDMAYATPRSIVNLSSELELADAEDWDDLAQGTCGATWAGQFSQHLKWWSRCIDPRVFLIDPVGTPLPDGMPFVRVLVKSSVLLLEDTPSLLGEVTVLLDRIADTDCAEFTVAGLSMLTALHARGKVPNVFSTKAGKSLSEKMANKTKVK